MRVNFFLRVSNWLLIGFKAKFKSVVNFSDTKVHTYIHTYIHNVHTVYIHTDMYIHTYMYILDTQFRRALYWCARTLSMTVARLMEREGFLS